MEQEDVVSLVENRSLTAEEIGVLASLIVDEPDHYTVLGVNRTASNQEIQDAYCLAVRYFHPLKSREITETDSVMHWKLSSAFNRIEQAFAVLSHKSRRKVYDDNLSSRVAPLFQPRILQHPQTSPTQTVIPKPVTNEMRRVPRLPLNLPLRVSFDRHWQEITESLDVSPLGIRFRLSRPVEPGSQLRIEMPMPRNLRTRNYSDEVYVVDAFVLYATNHDSGRQVVAEFI